MLFFSVFLEAHLDASETCETYQGSKQDLYYLVKESKVPDTKIFCICLEAWNMFSQDLYQGKDKKTSK